MIVLMAVEMSYHTSMLSVAPHRVKSSVHLHPSHTPVKKKKINRSPKSKLRYCFIIIYHTQHCYEIIKTEDIMKVIKNQ